ncbi:hypothetical protein [Azospirillum sp. B2RO_4]|uniref:hypothetical protein n=1 Tax=Azospirillum sp. B2RO_4 TaxID=3027796 RepID=UPI003DA8A000
MIRTISIASALSSPPARAASSGRGAVAQQVRVDPLVEDGRGCALKAAENAVEGHRPTFAGDPQGIMGMALQPPRSVLVEIACHVGRQAGRQREVHRTAALDVLAFQLDQEAIGGRPEMLPHPQTDQLAVADGPLRGAEDRSRPAARV